jgi:predicted AlkP superfamily pyrophosphatase or phosphodiesterase
MRSGVMFTGGYQDHALTETAPGHSTLLSGRPPASTGIFANDLGVQDSATVLVRASATRGPAWPGASPRRFRGTGLFDWLLARDSATRVLAVSRKDRSAIIPVGRARGNVFWWATGVFTTSSWYSDSVPSWLYAWNMRGGPAALTGKEWGLLRDPAAYVEADSLSYENSEFGEHDVTFPHRLPADTGRMLVKMRDYPWMDSLTLDVALEGLHRTGVGQREGTDLLVVSLSTTDAIGHAFGPESREMHDQLLRLDHWLGWFLDSLAVLVPRERTVFALTSDHGVQPFPERTGRGGRVSFKAMAQRTAQEYLTRYGIPIGVTWDLGLITADLAALRARGVNVDSLSDALAREARSMPGVARVFTPRTLARAPAGDEEARLWRRAIPPKQDWLIAAASQPGWIWVDTPGWTNHGSTQRIDMHVPIIFMGPGIAPRRVARKVTTEDIGPTFAALAGVRPTEPVSGRVLPEIAPGR